jgi:hypothetical protein
MIRATNPVSSSLSDPATRSNVDRGSSVKEFAWQFIPDDRWSRWRQTFNKSLGGMAIDGGCPICEKPCLLRWYAVEFGEPGVMANGEPHIGHGRLWECCSNCLSYEYIPDNLVPAWWQPPFDVEPASIGVTHQVIEEIRRSSGHREADL